MKETILIRDMIYVSLMSVVIALCSWISVPSVIPFTMQTFALFCALLLLGGKRGFFSVALYILLGAFGLPVFSGFQGGIGVLLGPTGGYIIGFLLSALLFLLLEKRISDLVLLILGLLVCYLFGTLWFVYVYSAGEKEWEVYKQRLVDGVPITGPVQKEFMAVRDQFNLDYKFPWED